MAHSSPDRKRRRIGSPDSELASDDAVPIFDIETESDKERLRSLPFLRSLVSDTNVLQEYRGWNVDKKRTVAMGVRDLYLASMKGLLGQDEKGLLAKLVDVLDESDVGCVAVEGMTVSFHPSANFKTVKFIEDLGAKVDAAWGPCFARVLDKPQLFAVFVDAAELSFHNFENIVPVDQWIEAQSAVPPCFELADAQEVQPGLAIWTAKLGGVGVSLLERLSALDLYVDPLNKSTRGGERFIFHSPILSRALTTAISSSGLLDRLAAPADDFRFVNYVFRCNRFAPGDAMFAAHRDTPYYDAARSQVSRYTLLIYLTAGTNPDGVLKIDGTALDSVGEFTCVVFDQRYEHVGRPFVDGAKVFLRTELVFTDKNLARNNPLGASLFSRACYMTGQGVFDAELAAHAHACFERSNSLRWAATTDNKKEPVLYLYKQFRGARWLTNGYDYWFPRGNTGGDGGVKDCAMLAVLDYFNCKLGDRRPFRSLCRSTTVREEVACTTDAFQLMSSREATPGEDDPSLSAFRRLDENDVEKLFKRTPDAPFTKRALPSWMDDEDGDEDEDEDVNEGCCPMHAWTTFDAWSSEDVAREYRRCCAFARKKLFGAPLLFLGQEMVVNEKQVDIVGDKILFHVSDRGDDSTESLRFNFAACWGDAAVGAELYVDVDQEISAPKLLIPPIIFHEYPEGYHMVLDFFRNDWMVQVDDTRKIPIPVITNDVPDELEDSDEGGPFWQRVKTLAGEDQDELEQSFWTRDSDGEITDDE